MKTIEIITQKQYDELPNSFGQITEVNIKCDLIRIKPIECCIQSVYGNATIKYVSDNATIQSVSDNATIKYISDNATIKYVYGNATIQSVYGNTTIKSVYGNATIKSVYGNATIQSVYGNATIQIFNCNVKIITIKQNAVIIFQDCKPVIKIKHKFVLFTKTQKHNIETFCDIYKDNLINKNNITLYKSVNTETLCDFRTGKIKYKGTVECPDWNPDSSIQCDNGLHLSPTPEMALSYNKGKLLKCSVAIKDIAVYGNDITKVRCKKVKVIGEV